MIGKGATPSFFAIANDNYTLTFCLVLEKSFRSSYEFLKKYITSLIFIPFAV